MEQDDEAGAAESEPSGAAAGQPHATSLEVSPSDVLVHGRGSIEDVLEVLRDMEETWHRGARAAETVGAATRTFGSHDEFQELAKRVREKKAKVVLRKLFLYSGQCSVMQEIWIQDKANPDASRHPCKSYAVTHAHHHWNTRIRRLEDIKPEHLAIVDAVNARHISDRGSEPYQGDNPFHNTFIEQSGGATLKVFPEGWTCGQCGQSNLSHHSSCRGPNWECRRCRVSNWPNKRECFKCRTAKTQPDCSGRRPGAPPPRCASWNWQDDPSRNEDLALILREANAALEWTTGGAKSMTRAAGDDGSGGGNGCALALSELMSMSRKKVYPEKKKEEVGTTCAHESPLGTVAAAAQPMLDSSLLPDPAPMQSPFSVLFVGANMERHAQLRIKEECQIIRKELHSRFGEDAWRPYATFQADCFADPASFMHDVMEIGPGILQFSCHGETRGLWFSQGFTEASAIVDALRAHNRQVETEGSQRIQLVVVNACMSGPLAQALCECVDFVIGHGHSEVGDEEALTFSKTLYYSLGRGMSLDGSFKAAKLASEPFHLYQRFNSDKFFLPVPNLSKGGVHGSVSENTTAGTPTPSTPLGSTCNDDLKDFLERLDLLEFLEDVRSHLRVKSLRNLQSAYRRGDLESAEMPNFPNWAKQDLLEGVAQLLSPNADQILSPNSDQDLSQASTPVIQSPRAVVGAYHVGDSQNLRQHVTSLFEHFNKYYRRVEHNVQDQSYCLSDFDIDIAQEFSGNWTFCMLIWSAFMGSAHVSQDGKESWLQQCQNFPQQRDLLPVIDELTTSCMIQDHSQLDEIKAKVDRYVRRPIEDRVAAVAVVDVIVQAHLIGDDFAASRWQTDVVRGWYDSREGPEEFLLRANIFLGKSIDGIKILQKAFETGSYVMYMNMSSLGAFLLFEHLELTKRGCMPIRKSGVATAAAEEGEALLHGFQLLMSSSGHVFSLDDAADVPAPTPMPVVFKGLRCLARLEAQEWEMLGPIQTVHLFMLHSLFRDQIDGVREYAKEFDLHFGTYEDSASGKILQIDEMISVGASFHVREDIEMDAGRGLPGSDEARARNSAEGEEERRIFLRRMGYGVGEDAHTSANVKRTGSAQELLNMLVKGHFICFIGPPASGKTVTMLQVACAACRACANEGSEQNDVPPHVPIFMRAAQLSYLCDQESKEIKSLEALVQLYISDQYSDNIASLLTQLLRLRHVLIIIDGMDEAARHRSMIEKMIDEAASDRDICLMISTRDYAFRTSRKEKRFGKFEAWDILPLDELGRNELIEKRLTRQEASEFNRQLAEGAQQTQEMTSSPFLLALLIEVFKGPDGKIPDKRNELYDKQVDATLMRHKGFKHLVTRESMKGPRCREAVGASCGMAAAEGEADIKLETCDGHVVKVPMSIAAHSGTIDLMIQNAGDNEAIPLKDKCCTRSITNRVVEYVTKHAEFEASSSDDEVIRQFDKEFQQQNNEDMLQIMAAANYLDIKDLLQFTVRVIFQGKQLYQKARSSAECLDALRDSVRAVQSDPTDESFDLVSLRFFLEVMAFSCQVRLERRDFEWDEELTREVDPLWQRSNCPDVPLELISRFVLGLASMGLLSKVGDGKFRFSHLSMQEYLAASCAVRLFGRDGAQGLLEQLSTAASGFKSPLHSSWRREVLQFTACMLPDKASEDTDCKATFTDFCSAVLECDDGTGACCELVQDFLKERDPSEAVEQMLRDQMQKNRGTDLLLAGLCHPCLEMRSLVLSEMIEFETPSKPFEDATVSSLMKIAEDTGCVWHKRAAAILSIAHIAQMKHCSRSNRTETIRWLLVMLQSGAMALVNVHFALVKALGTILKQDASDSAAGDGIMLEDREAESDESVVLQLDLRENIFIANVLSDLKLFSVGLVDWLLREPCLIAKGTWPIRHVHFICDKIVALNDSERASRLADSLLHRLHSPSFKAPDRVLLLKGLNKLQELVSAGIQSKTFLFLESGVAEQRARVLAAAADLRMPYAGAEAIDRLASCLLEDVSQESENLDAITKQSLLAYVLHDEEQRMQRSHRKSTQREHSTVFAFLYNIMELSSQHALTKELLDFERRLGGEKPVEIVEKSSSEVDQEHQTSSSDIPRGITEASAPELLSVELEKFELLPAELEQYLPHFAPDRLLNDDIRGKYVIRNNKLVSKHYCSASLWTSSGLLQETSADIAEWLKLLGDAKVPFENTLEALKHLQEPWIGGHAGTDGEWERQVVEALQLESLGRFIFAMLLSYIREKIQKEISRSLEGLMGLSKTIRQWVPDTDEKTLERLFLLKELSIGRRDAQLPTWSGTVSKVRFQSEMASDLCISPAVHSSIDAQAQDSTTEADKTDRDCNELVRFLKDHGLSRIAAQFSETIGMELVEDLRMLQTADLEEADMSFLKRWQKWKLIQLARDITAGSASLRDSDLDGIDLSGGDTASEGGDDTDSIFDAVLAKHPGNPEHFQEHMQGLIQGFSEFLWLIPAEVDVNTETFNACPGLPDGVWSYCMLVWVRFAKECYLEGLLQDKWLECIKSPSQDRLLALLDSCLKQPSTQHTCWTRAEFKWLCCSKPFAAAVFVTDMMVRQSLERHAESVLMWQQEVVKDWFENEEDASVLLLRANRFLREHAVNGISVVTQVVETH